MIPSLGSLKKFMTEFSRIVKLMVQDEMYGLWYENGTENQISELFVK